jgi:hypothetical protein
VASAFEAAGGRALSRRKRSALVGAADGSCSSASSARRWGWRSRSPAGAAVQVPLAVGGVLVAAAVFGVLAYTIVRNGVWDVIGLFVGGIAGAFLSAQALGAERMLVAVLPGMVAGTLLPFPLRKYGPRFRVPRVANATHGRRRAGGEDVTAEPPPDGPASIQKGWSEPPVSSRRLANKSTARRTKQRRPTGPSCTTPTWSSSRPPARPCF